MAAAHVFDDELDYEVWARVTKSTLTVKGLWDVVETGVPPDPSKNPELAATVQAEELSRWRDLADKDMKALQVLQASLQDSPPLSASSAKDVWDSIGRTSLGKIFEGISMHEAENLGLYMDRVTDIVEQLRRFNVVKPDDEVIRKVLNTVTSKYKMAGPIREEHMDPKKMTLESLCEFFDIYDSVVDEHVHRMLRGGHNIPMKGRGVYCGELGQEKENLRNKIKANLTS